MENNILIDKLLKQANRNMVSFHVPGHKNGKIFERYNYKNFLQYLVSMDVTEIEGMDNLHAPEGMILEAQRKAAEFFGADESYFLVDGTSCGVLSAIMAVTNPKDQILAPRDCHKSVSNGIILGDLYPIYINPKVNHDFQISAGLTPDTVEAALSTHVGIKAVVLTYPNYYGICSDIEEIVRIAHQYDKIVIVDEAHGAHLKLHERLPISALEAGADIVIQSTHKTLPAFTQSSMLHVKSNRIDRERLRLMLSIHQSTSPSYLLMASLDMARAIAQQDGRFLMEKLLEAVNEFHMELKNEKGIRILGKEMIGTSGIQNIDPTKLVIDLSDLGISGPALEKLLRTRCHIQVEMANIYNVVALSSIGNEQKDFARLLRALRSIKAGKGIAHKNITLSEYSYGIPDMQMTPREAVYSRKKEIAFLQSSGKISGEYIIPYPPGIPILCPGEVITAEMIEYVQQLKDYGIYSIGMQDDQLETIKIIDV
ncbi:aminotransferase class I/II-fold pyridoxal phosphate-dependent enzyme [Geosporobacter ferrireducens]|uniref:Arginine decarboxylase n=1 Tax=Geosporobacter ferrireducens TaxID=1424294 RepID=A0A1D8GHB6_9FIRM|nr:aminotransferase class I/II-fold pyridoxal phosphate-dependent enzyme [Geosporobacter ferrireducens]AOT70291.1 arginine decarboxylase [Geosporobacter ferrireducens]MTI55745.1 aminotransferase class I/II-fold pyridoxal phosphate-dependent enzyme [Geosporobacter ferrireducens]